MKNKIKNKDKKNNLFYYLAIVLIVIWLYRRLFNKQSYVPLTQDSRSSPEIGGIYWAVNEYFSTTPNGTKFLSGGVYEKYGPIQDWDVGQITNMNSLYIHKYKKNVKISCAIVNKMKYIYFQLVNSLKILLFK